MIYMRRRFDHLPRLGNKNSDVHLVGKGAQKRKNHEFNFRLKIDLQFSFIK